MKILIAEEPDYRSLNSDCEALTFSTRFIQFYDRCLGEWFRGRAAKFGGGEGIYPVGYDEEDQLVFDLRNRHRILRFTTERMELRARAVHEECYERIWVRKELPPDSMLLDTPPRGPRRAPSPGQDAGMSL